MNHEFADQLKEMYQGEIIGEVLFNLMLKQFPEPEQQLKSAIMLQLETETKARLRPAMISLGVDVYEDEPSRKGGVDFAAALEGKSWQEAMAVLRDGITPYVERYKEVADAAPNEYKELAHSMVEHEESLYEFVKAEASGDGDAALRRIEKQLHYPLR